MEFNYLVERTRMLNSLGRVDGKCTGVTCENCPLYLQNKFNCTCHNFESNHPLEAIEVVRKWAEEHPRKTRKDILLEKFPNANAALYNEIPEVCCLLLGMTEPECNRRCVECWNTKVVE